MWLPDGRGREWEGSGAWGYQIQLRIDLQEDPAEYLELCLDTHVATEQRVGEKCNYNVYM